MRSLFFIQLGLVFLLAICSSSYDSSKDKSDIPASGDSVQVWWSSELMPGSEVWYTNPPSPGEITYKLSRQKALDWKATGENQPNTFNIDTTTTYQSILGIGTSLEATSIYALLKNKSDKEVRTLIRNIIDPVDGIGLNMFRITIGTSDFSDGRAFSKHPKGFYTYQEQPDIPFSIQPDIDLKIIKVLQMFIEEARSINQDILFFASCWSPPAWMKTSDNLIGGTLKKGYEKQLASYFRKFIEAYAEQGIPVYAMTIQNEPNFSPDTYPGMILSPQQERDIAIAVYDEFNSTSAGKKKIITRIWINDHNMDSWKNAKKVLDDLKAMVRPEIVDGVAFHNYEPNTSPKSMSKLHELYPDKDIHLTEHSEWGVSGMYNIQEYFLNWSRSYTYWVPMTTIKTDEHNQGPYNTLSELSPPLFIERGVYSSDMYVTPEYYLLSQFSRFIRPGAVRLSCNKGSVNSLTSLVFRNKDNNIVQVLVNQTNKEQPFITWLGDRCFESSLPPKSVGSYEWKDKSKN